MNSASEAEKLTWPPTPEDLRRLYVDEHLSAAKIAARYGLRYASPKTAESTVLYHLKKNGISRRDKTEHIRKVTEEVVDRWVKRYEAGESLKQIAGNEFSPVSVFLHLRKRGMKLRDKVEAQIKAVTKHKRTPFTAQGERNYLLGFAWGDCAVERHGRAVRVKTGTTHPDFVTLFTDLFAGHGNLRTYPKAAKVVPAELNLEIDLDGSFEFLLMKKAMGYLPNLKDKAAVLNFVAGLFDAEGCITYHVKRYGADFEVQISNSDERLLRTIHEALEKLAYHPKLYHSIYSPPPLGTKLVSHQWKLTIHRHEEVKRFLEVMPLRHKEKVTKAALALSYMNGESELDSDGFPEGWREYLGIVKRQTAQFIEETVAALARQRGKQSLPTSEAEPERTVIQ
jgi:intein-encoded DNA endonuclease-like protein